MCVLLSVVELRVLGGMDRQACGAELTLKAPITSNAQLRIMTSIKHAYDPVVHVMTADVRAPGVLLYESSHFAFHVAMRFH